MRSIWDRQGRDGEPGSALVPAAAGFRSLDGSRRPRGGKSKTQGLAGVASSETRFLVHRWPCPPAVASHGGGWQGALWGLL